MPIEDALIPNPITINAEYTVEQALTLINKHQIRSVPIVENSGKFIGMFGLHSLLDDLLPMAAKMEEGVKDLDFVVGGAPSAAKKIRKLAHKSVLEVIKKTEEHHLKDDMSILESIRRLYKYGSPLPVVTKELKFLGLISEQSCLNHLNEVLKEVEAEEKLNTNL